MNNRKEFLVRKLFMWKLNHEKAKERERKNTYVYKKTALMILKFFSSTGLHDATHCVKSCISNLNFFELKCRTKNSGRSKSSATVQIIAIHMMARPGCGLYLSGKHIAYHRSIDMNVSVKIETVTLTVCVHANRRQENSKAIKEKLD